MSRHARLAETTVFTACWLEEVACAATVPRMEENSVVRVAFHLFFMVIICDERFGCHAFVEKYIWQSDSNWYPKSMGARQSRPCCRNKDAFSNEQQGHKEYLIPRVSGWSLHHRIHSPKPRDGFPSICNCQIDSSILLFAHQIIGCQHWQFHWAQIPKKIGVRWPPGFFFGLVSTVLRKEQR